MPSPIQTLIDRAMLHPTPEGQETFACWPCEFCGKDGDSRGVCCKGVIQIQCPTCSKTLIVDREPEDPQEDDILKIDCPECAGEE